VCGSFTAEVATHQHVKLHHAYTNIIGLGDSSTWKAPFFPRYIYLFILPLAVPIITPIVALGKCLQTGTAPRYTTNDVAAEQRGLTVPPVVRV
ncbi:hypothetical protein chiPu_0022549, partial [Chiloscyllium punctatum]|nr:hypothetical protein [Chiloscyllium punctatum]